MFWDAACCRKIINQKSLSGPLSDIEIYNATRIKYQRDPTTGSFFPVPRKYRKQWLLLLESIDEGESSY